MFFGINQICLTDLLNSQINDIYSSQPSEKGWQRHVSRAPRDEKNKRNPRGEEKKKSSVKYRTYECMKCEMPVWKLKTVICQNMQHNNCMRLYGNLAAEYATHLLQKRRIWKWNLHESWHSSYSLRISVLLRWRMSFIFLQSRISRSSACQE